MKKIIYSIVFLFTLAISSTNAQIATPAPSPSATISQAIGLIDVKVEYSRPIRKGRKVFGEVVPFNELWRTGANQATKVTFSDSVTIAGQGLAKGTYSLFSIPGEKEWVVIFNNDTKASTTAYSKEKDALRVTVPAKALGYTAETFTIAVDNLGYSNGEICIYWENTMVCLPIDAVTTESKIAASIKSTLDGPSADDYNNAAGYYLDRNLDMKQALAWVNMSLAKSEKFWVVRRKALILEKMGDYKAAIAAAERSKELATTAKNMDYVRMNEKSIGEWKKK
jgi:hypothetical protein